jgi:hypothetical protein
MYDYDCHIQLLSGGLQDFDVDDLRNNTKYTGGYTESSRSVKLFWEVYIHLNSFFFSPNAIRNIKCKVMYR